MRNSPADSAPRFILLNGPPRSGKDTAAAALRGRGSNKLLGPSGHTVVVRFSAPCKAAFCGLVGTYCDTVGNIIGYEDRKDEVVPSLGVSCRQFQIDFSEKFMKPLYGPDIFGRLLVARVRPLLASGVRTVIVPDAGFQEEVAVVEDAFGPQSITLIRIARDGTKWDSRGYVTPHPDSRFASVTNGDKQVFEGQVLRICAGH